LRHPDVGDDHLDGAFRQLAREGIRHLGHLLGGVLDRNARSEAHVHHVHRFVDLRKERGRQARCRPHRSANEHGREKHDCASKREYVTQGSRIAVGHAIDEPLDSLPKAAVLRMAKEVSASDGRHRHADEVRRHHCDCDGDRERRKELAGEACQEHHRQENRHRGQGRGEHG
jgi:hypothetical protein